jgi:NAD(P)-dependent dehydrogenase (short-subunit alcohol dehydrogenase family)
MTAQLLSGRNALVLGVERPAGRAAAVALAEAGADVAVVTLSEDAQAVFAANSTVNEFWALDRKGAVLTTTGGSSLPDAIVGATAALGPISIAVIAASHPISREALAGLRSDPAIVVLVGDGDPSGGAELLEWTRDLAASGLRANALVATRALADSVGPLLKEQRAPEPMDLARAVVYLASDATAAIEGAMVVAESLTAND